MLLQQQREVFTVFSQAIASFATQGAVHPIEERGFVNYNADISTQTPNVQLLLFWIPTQGRRKDRVL